MEQQKKLMYAWGEAGDVTWWAGDVLHSVPKNTSSKIRKIVMVMLAPEGVGYVKPNRINDYSKEHES